MKTLSRFGIVFLLPVYMKMKALVAGIVLLFLSLPVYTNGNDFHTLNGENKIFLITLDGFRWQEVFGGADPALLQSTAANTQQRYAGTAAGERRKKLLPFFWNVVAREGEIFGNRNLGSRMNVANPYALSYPGYNELLTGRVDPRLFNNGKVANPNLSVLEWLNSTIPFRNKVAAFASWDAFPYILNRQNSSFFLNSGFEALPAAHPNTTEAHINAAMKEVEDQKNTRSDELTYLACRTYVQHKKPSVVFLAFGGTDEAAHEKDYAAYLAQATAADRMISDLWALVQSLPEYSGKTTFVITTDHGRGAAADSWHTHGLLVDGSSQTWMAVIGPAVPALGERKGGPRLYLKNVKDFVLKLLAQP